MQRQILYTVLTQSVDGESYMFILKSHMLCLSSLCIGILGSVHALEANCPEISVVYIRHFARIME